MAKRRKGRIGMGDKWVGELVSVLNDFTDEEVETIEETFKETAKDTRDMVSASSPSRTGDYASGWEVIEEVRGAMGETVSFTVANPKHYQLTHLLEKGHAVKNQFGEPERAGAKRRVSAKRHIKPAEVWGNESLLARLREKL